MKPQDRSDWHALAKGLKPDTKLLIDGRWSKAWDGGHLISINPAPGYEVACIACGAGGDIARAGDGRTAQV